MADMDVSKYEHSPVHKAVILKDYDELRRIIAGLPQLCSLSEIKSESIAIAEEAKADAISAVIDLRDVPNRETPLHLAVKFSDVTAVEILMQAGADRTLRNDQGWNPLEEAVYNGQDQIAKILIRHHEKLVMARWCRRKPRLVSTFAKMRDFYMEIMFHFESSVIPFISRVFPSDTYKIWKRGANLRVDMTMAGFDNLKIKRADQSVMFFAEGVEERKVHPGAICLVSHKHKEVVTPSDRAPAKTTDADVQRKLNNMKTKMYNKPALDMTQAVLVPQTSWKGKDKTETVGSWKTKVYDMHNVVVSVKSRRNPGIMPECQPSNSCNKSEIESSEFQDALTEEERKQLQSALQTDSFDSRNETSSSAMAQDQTGGKDRETKAEKKARKEEKKRGGDKNNTFQKYYSGKEKTSKTHRSQNKSSKQSDGGKQGKDGVSEQSEIKKSLRPVLWLSPDFPLKIDELLPLLDILANKVKAVRRIREMLTTKLPKGTFPVKLAIPVVPTVRVIVTFTKFEELEPLDEFQTPPSSPDFDECTEDATTLPSSSNSSWLRWRKSIRPNSSSSAGDPYSSFDVTGDPFDLPLDYKWITDEELRRRRRERRKSEMAKGKAQ